MTDFTKRRSKRAKAQGYQKKEVQKDVLTLALERIRYVYDLFDTIAVSFSGGKDSIALEWITRQCGIEQGILALSNLEFNAFMDWMVTNQPPYLDIVANTFPLSMFGNIIPMPKGRGFIPDATDKNQHQ